MFGVKDRLDHGRRDASQVIAAESGVGITRKGQRMHSALLMLTSGRSRSMTKRNDVRASCFSLLWQAPECLAAAGAPLWTEPSQLIPGADPYLTYPTSESRLRASH